MASRALVGFIGGFADSAQRGLELRQAEEAERKKAELLARLRVETEKELEDYRAKQDARKVSKDNSSIDAARGVRINRNDRGEVIGETQLTPTELEAHRLSLEGARLDVENTRSTIQSRSLDDARNARYTDALISNMNRKEEKGTTTGDKGNKILLAEAERTFSDMAEVVNPAVVMNAKAQFERGVNELGWSERTQRVFLREMMQRTLKPWTNTRTGQRRPALMDSQGIDPLPVLE